MAWRVAEFVRNAAALFWRSVLQIAICALLAPVVAYRWTISPLIGQRCRFLPTCSEYALVAIQRFGPIRGVWLTAKRLMRCHPLCEGGFDPVPPRHDDDEERKGK